MVDQAGHHRQQHHHQQDRGRPGGVGRSARHGGSPPDSTGAARRCDGPDGGARRGAQRRAAGPPSLDPPCPGGWAGVSVPTGLIDRSRTVGGRGGRRAAVVGAVVDVVVMADGRVERDGRELLDARRRHEVQLLRLGDDLGRVLSLGHRREQLTVDGLLGGHLALGGGEPHLPLGQHGVADHHRQRRADRRATAASSRRTRPLPAGRASRTRSDGRFARPGGWWPGRPHRGGALGGRRWRGHRSTSPRSPRRSTAHRRALDALALTDTSAALGTARAPEDPPERAWPRRRRTAARAGTRTRPTPPSEKICFTSRPSPE